MGYDYSKSKPILTTTGLFFKWVGNCFWQFLNFDLKLWWLLVGLSLFILVIIILAKFQSNDSFKPDFYNYREGQFKRWKWTWDWKWSASKNAWIISDMQAHCPKCDTPLIEYSSVYSLSYDCPRCDFRAKDAECDQPHKIERIILDNIDRKQQEKKNSP